MKLLLAAYLRHYGRELGYGGPFRNVKMETGLLNYTCTNTTL